MKYIIVIFFSLFFIGCAEPNQLSSDKSDDEIEEIESGPLYRVGDVVRVSGYTFGTSGVIGEVAAGMRPSDWNYRVDYFRDDEVFQTIYVEEHLIRKVIY